MKRMMILTGLAVCIACSSARRMPEGDLQAARETASMENGRHQYMKYCQKCHPMGEEGLGPALNNKPTPGFVEKFQVRHGLGAMPAFKKDVISRSDLKDLIKYLHARKKAKRLS
ncbi:cytochrome c [Chitinophaga sp. YIM B06452]|uniref:c-type cytochrome n=1 Tax=Chitinophaga sp. YIM B06452 TaxID=3082158 RepID=UPI0031FEA65C